MGNGGQPGSFAAPAHPPFGIGAGVPSVSVCGSAGSANSRASATPEQRIGAAACTREPAAAAAVTSYICMVMSYMPSGSSKETNCSCWRRVRGGKLASLRAEVDGRYSRTI